jgi:hypothetical protein
MICSRSFLGYRAEAMSNPSSGRRWWCASVSWVQPTRARPAMGECCSATPIRSRSIDRAELVVSGKGEEDNSSSLRLMKRTRAEGTPMRDIAFFLSLVVVMVFSATTAVPQSLSRPPIQGTLSTDTQSYDCPSPEKITCLPTAKQVDGWTHNGGSVKGNSFASSDQCANIISLDGTSQRLVCCYTKCGIFTRDVGFKDCQKTSLSHFECGVPFKCPQPQVCCSGPLQDGSCPSHECRVQQIDCNH